MSDVQFVSYYLELFSAGSSYEIAREYHVEIFVSGTRLSHYRNMRATAKKFYLAGVGGLENVRSVTEVW
jgi:hypothetical protein